MSQLSHLDALEAEAIYIIREVAAECEKPVMLYSIGKDSSVMLHLAMKAFYPEKPPFPFLHVNTTWKFKEMIQFRDETAKKLGINMIEYINEDGVKRGINPFDYGSQYTDIMKTQALKQALNKYGFTAAFGGGRRDEEKSRAKERIFSFRNENHAWDPKNQRPEMWKLYNSKINKGESIRVFPISNWTETDIWEYIKRENIDIVPLYFAAKRPVIERDGQIIMVDDDRLKLRPGEKIERRADESAGLLEVRVAHEDAHGAALDGGDRRVGRRALAPVAKLQEAQSHVLARTREGEAADHEDGLDGLGFGLGERLLDLLHLKVGALERRAVGELGHHHQDALVFLRHERGWQRLEAPDHQADDGGVGDEHDAPAVDRLGDEGLDGLREGVEAAVEPAEEAALAVVLLMVDRLEHRGAEGRRQCQGDDDGKRHG